MHEKEQEKVKQIEGWIDLDGAIRRQLRRKLRKQGLRVR